MREGNVDHRRVPISAGFSVGDVFPPPLPVGGQPSQSAPEKELGTVMHCRRSDGHVPTLSQSEAPPVTEYGYTPVCPLVLWSVRRVWARQAHSSLFVGSDEVSYVICVDTVVSWNRFWRTEFAGRCASMLVSDSVVEGMRIPVLSPFVGIVTVVHSERENDLFL